MSPTAEALLSTSPGPVALGSWACRSGNSVDVYLGADAGEGVRDLVLAWDSPPPLSTADQVDYELRILPAIIRRTQEYLGRPGAVLVVRP